MDRNVRALVKPVLKIDRKSRAIEKPGVLEPNVATGSRNPRNKSSKLR
jgi:hypothetical protein